MNLKYRKILINEFDKLKILFPSDDKLWNKYRLIRLEELKNQEVDVFAIELDQEFIGEITVNYVSHSLENEAILGRRVYL